MRTGSKALLVLLGVVVMIGIKEASASRLPQTTKTTLLYYEVPLSWNDAVSVCNERNGVLANVEDNVKFSAVTEALAAIDIPENNATSEIWIGLHAMKSSFYWSSCQNTNSSSMKWETYTPSTNQTEECGAMSTSSNLWTLRKCNETRTFFCEVYEECGCSMEKFNRCADLSRTQYVNTTTGSLEECLNLCLDHVNVMDQCWSISYYGHEHLCQINERIAAYTNLCVFSTGVHHYHKNCFGVGKFSRHSAFDSVAGMEESPKLNCEVARNMTNLEKNCNFSSNNHILSLQFVTDPPTATPSTCTCLCNHRNDVTSNITLSEQLLWLRRTLSIDKKLTSLVKRSKTSATDSRTSAQGLGYAGGIILVVVIGGVVSLDLSRLLHDIKTGLTRSRRFFSNVNKGSH